MQPIGQTPTTGSIGTFATRAKPIRLRSSRNDNLKKSNSSFHISAKIAEVSRHLLNVWFPGSAWEPTDLQAPPAEVRRGRASCTVRSQAEPGNEFLNFLKAN